jgi:O-antigen/teichoic acid export membrane protein
MANTVITAGLGVCFWIFAARSLRSEVVGRDSALIASMVTLSTVCQLNMGNALVRFLPRTGDRTRRVVLGAYAASLGVALLLGAAFVLVMPHISSRFGFLASDHALAVSYVLAVMLWPIFALQDAVLTALRSAPWVPLENGAFGVLKIAGLAILVTAGTRHAIFFAWVVPMAILLVPVNLVIFRRAIPRHLAGGGPRSVIEQFTRRRLLRFLGQDYFATIVGMGGALALPLLVVALLGGHKNAFFYMPYTIIGAFELLFASIATSLIVEGAFDENRLAILARRAAWRVAAVAVPGAVLLIAAAPLILLPFGSDYAREGAPVLRVLACATAFRAVTILWVAVQRVRGRSTRILGVRSGHTGILIGLTVVLAHPLGLVGVAVAWVAASVTLGVAVAPGLVRLLRAPRGREGDDSPRLPLPASEGVATG